MIAHTADDELLRIIQANDDKAFAVLVYRYNVRLFKIITHVFRCDDELKTKRSCPAFSRFWSVTNP